MRRSSSIITVVITDWRRLYHNLGKKSSTFLQIAQIVANLRSFARFGTNFTKSAEIS
jgi:hypothetical protein